MPELRAQFEAYGADYDVTMARFLGNEAMYLKFLNMLPQDDSLQKLGQALDGGDLTAAFAAAHTLKGVTGNLGLTPLYQAVCAIVEPLRAGEPRDYSAAYQTVRREFHRVEELLERLKEGGQA